MAEYGRVLSSQHIPPYLFLSREDDDDLRDIKKHDLCSVQLHPMLSNANRGRHFKIQVHSIRANRTNLFSFPISDHVMLL